MINVYIYLQTLHNVMKFKSSILVTIICLISYLTQGVKCQQTLLDEQLFRPLSRSVKELLYNFISSHSTDEALEFNRRAGVKLKYNIFGQSEPLLQYIFKFRNFKSNSMKVNHFFVM